jgi:histidinol phosphatase-like PHP family hydrolase
MAVPKNFSSSDATLAAFGQEVTGFKKVSYMSKQEGTLNHSGNNKATSYSLGKETPEVKLELYMNQIREWEKIRKEQTGNSNLKGMEVSLAVTYANEDLEEVTDTIDFIILSQGREVGGGAEGLAYELETLCLGIQFAA